MDNTREEEEEKLHYTTLNYKIEIRTILKLCISPSLEPRGVFIATTERGARDKPWPKMRSWPYDHGNAAQLGPRAVPSVPCQVLLLVSGFGPLILTNQLF